MTLLQKIDKNQPLSTLEVDQSLPRHLRIRAVALQWRCQHLQPSEKAELTLRPIASEARA